jgi:hypothetical protein
VQGGSWSCQKPQREEGGQPDFYDPNPVRKDGVHSMQIAIFRKIQQAPREIGWMVKIDRSSLGESFPLEEHSETPWRKEVQMAWRVEAIPASAKYTSLETLDIRSPQEEQPIWFENSVDLAQDFWRVGKVFDHMPHRDQVERPIFKTTGIEGPGMHV